ncbi:MAG TPA: CPBP family intramembrane metalloprotease [Prolixibacteraceae bacterium]|nr:CPBP family intramembrane metalloprotease [Prolixibacteraceae bacterium]HPS13315.1 CPBP family intramembrane metalloprotease [Prolixibacteraceae bacterium]
MQNSERTYYPTTAEAIHLLVLYIFIQSCIDFPLALIDYQKDTNWLSNPWISFFSNVCVVSFIFIYGFRKANNKFTEVFALKMFNPLLIIPIIILFPGLQYLVGFINIGIEKAIPSPQWFWELFDRVLNNHFGFWGAFMKVAVLAPIIEETFFRGIIMHGLMRNYKSWYAILISGILFSVYHLNPWQMSYTFFLGLLLGWLMVRSRSLPLCIIAHSINNIIVLLSVTTKKDFPFNFFPTISPTGSILLSIGLIILGVGLVILFSQKKKIEKSASGNGLSTLLNRLKNH